MRTITRIAAVTAAAGLAAAAVAAPASAAKPKWAEKSSLSIVETAIAISSDKGLDDKSGDFDILIKALVDTGAVGLLLNDTDYTVFAPNDQAFMDTLGVETEQAAFDKAVDLLGVDGVVNVLKYHLTEGVRNSKSVTSAKRITMVNGGTITARGGFVDAGSTDAEFLATDIRVSDGVIHVIDTVLLP